MLLIRGNLSPLLYYQPRQILGKNSPTIKWIEKKLEVTGDRKKGFAQEMRRLLALFFFLDQTFRVEG